jgi:hypothetical protein
MDSTSTNNANKKAKKMTNVIHAKGKTNKERMEGTADLENKFRVALGVKYCELHNDEWAIPTDKEVETMAGDLMVKFIDENSYECHVLGRDGHLHKYYTLRLNAIKAKFIADHYAQEARHLMYNITEPWKDEE